MTMPQLPHGPARPRQRPPDPVPKPHVGRRKPPPDPGHGPAPDDHAGPYDAGFGQCVYGHPVNAMGRCAPLNANPDSIPPGCPSRAERRAYLLGQPVDVVVDIARQLGISIPANPTGDPLRQLLVPQILNAEGL